MRVIRFLYKHTEEILMSITLVTLVVMMTLQVIMRYVFNHALSFPEEVCRYCFIWMSYLGVSYAVKVGGALRVDIVAVLIPKIAPALNIIGDVFYVIFCGAMTCYGVNVIRSMANLGSRSAALEIPLWIVFLSLLAGCALALIRMIEKYIDLIRSKTRKGV